MNHDYVQKYDENNDPCECARCYSPAPTAKFHTNGTSPAGVQEVCQFCAETNFGNIMALQHKHSLETVMLARGIARSMNIINNRITELMQIAKEK